MKGPRSFVRALVAAFALVVGFSSAAAAQSPSPSPSAAPTPGPPASYYASYGLAAIAGLIVLAVLAGFLIQAPGFRRPSERRGGAASGE